MNIKNSFIHEKPSCILDLEAAYGPPGQEAFGSSVFYLSLNTDSLEQIALDTYRYFIGDLWQQYGKETWMNAWKKVYSREPSAAAAIITELQGLDDPDSMYSVPMILQNIDNADAARIALAGAFDAPEVTELSVYNIGDGDAMSGLLIAAWRRQSADATLLVFLMD